ncbi:MAG TPA: EamA family transporter, partial [Chitinophagaceae bacterium]|nr:EamA family transporter [Chitinophagaceae bacterium]
MTKHKTLTGIGLAVLATLIWSGNFIVARGIIHKIPPVSLAFWRWALATLILLPFAWKYFITELVVIRSHFLFFL